MKFIKTNLSSKTSEPKKAKFDRFKGEPRELVMVHEIQGYWFTWPFSMFSNHILTFFFFGGGGGGNILMSSSVPNDDVTDDLFKYIE